MKTILIALFLGGFARALADTVLLESGETVKGEITKETVKGLNIGARSYTRAQVVPDGITYDKKPDHLQKAQDALRSRDHKAAHQGFRAVIQLCESALGAGQDTKANGKGAKKQAAKAAPKSAISIRPLFLQHALWGEVQTYTDEGEPGRAAAAIASLLKACPDSWYLQEALLLKVRLAGDDAAAFSAAADEAIKVAGAAGAGAEIEDRIKVLKAENLARQGKKPEALKLYGELKGSSVKPVAEAAKLAIARGQLETDTVQAKITFVDLLRGSKDRSILCGAAQGLGDAQLKEMKGEKSIDALREALESYLKAEVLYFPAQGEPNDAHQAALLRGAQCAEEISQLAAKDGGKEKKNARIQEGFRAVAKDLYRELKAVYPKSEGARKADQALNRLQGQNQ